MRLQLGQQDARTVVLHPERVIESSGYEWRERSVIPCGIDHADSEKGCLGQE